MEPVDTRPARGKRASSPAPPADGVKSPPKAKATSVMQVDVKSPTGRSPASAGAVKGATKNLTSPSGDAMAANRPKRQSKMSSAMRASIEAAQTLAYSGPGEDDKSNLRKMPKVEGDFSNVGLSSPTPSKPKVSTPKHTSAASGASSTPPVSARTTRSATPLSSSTSVPAAPNGSSHEPTHATPTYAPPSVQTPQIWVTAPTAQVVAFFPASQPPQMLHHLAFNPHAESLLAPAPVSPPTQPAPPAPSNAMDVSEPAPDSGSTGPDGTAVSAEVPKLPAPKPRPPPTDAKSLNSPASKYHSKYYDTKRATLNVPAYSAAQIKQVQKMSAGASSEVGTMSFVPHVKKHFADSGRCASAGRVFIVDNGAYAVKLGFSTDTQPDVIHNMIGKPKAAKRKFVGAELGPVSGGYLPPAKGKAASSSSSSSSSSSQKDPKNDTCGDFRSLTITRPHDRGYVLNWDLQSQIWALEQLFQRKFPSAPAPNAKKGAAAAAAASYLTPPIAEAASHCLIVTEAHLAPLSLRQKLLEYAFTTAKFGSLFVCSSAFLSMIHHRHVQSYTGDHGTILADLGLRPETPKLPAPANNLCCLVVDVGYSFTHVTPFFEDYKLNYAIRRLNVGGKVLTNYLKEIVSFRHFNMMDQTYLMSLIKERLCFVSEHIEEDLKKCKSRKSELRKNYVLPDQTSSILGFVLGTQPTANDLPKSATQNGMDVDLMEDRTPDEAQVLSLGNERFSVPEVLFHPSDLGINQAGISETIVQSIMACPEYLREAMCANIVIVGGSAAIPGLCPRILSELRQMLPANYPIRLYISSTPGTTAWSGGKYLATQKAEWLDSVAVSIQEWSESGSHIPKHRFALF